jgi:hypothetical protein
MPNPPIAAFYVTAMIGGIASRSTTAATSFVSEMVPGEDRPNAVCSTARVTIAHHRTRARRGLLTVGYGWCFTVDWRRTSRDRGALDDAPVGLLRLAHSDDKSKGTVRTAIRYIAATPSLRISFVMLMVIGLLGYSFTVEPPSRRTLVARRRHRVHLPLHHLQRRCVGERARRSRTGSSSTCAMCSSARAFGIAP